MNIIINSTSQTGKQNNGRTEIIFGKENSSCRASSKLCLFKTLFNRARKLCLTEKIQDKTAYIEECIIKKRISKEIYYEIRKSKTTINRKPVFIHLTLKSKDISSRIDIRIKATQQRSFPSAQLFSVYYTRRSLNQSKVDQYFLRSPLNVFTNSHILVESSIQEGLK